MWSGLAAVLTEDAVAAAAGGFLGIPVVILVPMTVIGVGLTVYILNAARKLLPRGRG